MKEYPYSIADLERHSGVKAHTIRMWERRYALTTPHRDTKNVRHYAEEDLQRLVKIGRLCQEGHRISSLATLSEKEVDALYQKVVSCAGSSSVIVDKILEALMSSQESMLYEMLNERFDALGPMRFSKEIWHVTEERLAMLILSGVLHTVHMRLFDQVTTLLLESKTLDLIKSKLLCVGSALLINSCGHSSSYYHRLTKHLLVRSGYDVVSLTVCQSDWASLASIMTARKFDRLYIHYQAHVYDEKAPFDVILPWLPPQCEVTLYGQLQDDIDLPEGWQYQDVQSLSTSIEEISSYATVGV